jgi:gas vesicle protein
MGRFFLGFVIGAVIGVAAVIITAPRSGAATRQGIRELIDSTIAAGKEASATHERQLWSQYRARLTAVNREPDTGHRRSL